MQNNLVQKLRNETSMLPIARIDTFDESFSLPLREYLTTHGCQVFVNTGHADNVRYQLVIGDMDFVKGISDNSENIGKKVLYICWDTHHETLPFQLHSHEQFMSIDEEPLKNPLITKIFSILFTGKERIYNAQKNTHRTKTIRVMSIDPKEPKNINGSREQKPQEFKSAYDRIFRQPKELGTDTSRIASVVNSLYGKPSPTKKPKKQNIGISIIQGFITTIFTLAIIILFPFFYYFITFSLQSVSLYQAATCFQKGNIRCIKGALQFSHSMGKQQEFIGPFIYIAIEYLGYPTIGETYERASTIVSNATSIVDELIGLEESMAPVVNSLIPGEKPSGGNSTAVAVENLKRNIPFIRSHIDMLFSHLSMIKKAHVYPFQSPFIQTQLSTLEQELIGIRSIIETSERLTTIFPYIGGFKNPHRLLILLENNSELRPTGGFIGSVAKATIIDGAVSDFAVEDVYTLDGQLKGHVDPPQLLQTLWGQEHWYLRDSNWNPDFKESGAMARWFYEKETGEEVNTVVGITASFIVRLLTAIGPVDLPLYNDRIGADNFFAKANYYTQQNFFPGSTQKRDFLGSLTEEIVKKLLNDKTRAGVSLISAINTSLRARDIHFYTDTPELQTAFERYGWANRIPQFETCTNAELSNPCMFSYLAINESNVSINKVNPYISRVGSRTLEFLSTGEVKHTITRSIKNTSTTEPGTGTYKVFVRFIIPTQAVITGLTVNGKTVPTLNLKAKTNPLPFSTLEKGADRLTSAGVVLEVTNAEEKTLSFTYSLWFDPETAKNPHSVVFFEQKQPGVDTVSLKTTAIPRPDRPLELLANPGVYEYNSTLTTDEEETFVIN